MIAEFFHMDGFAVWVWSAFGLTALVMSVAAVLVRRRHQAMLRQAHRYHSERGRR
jgi:heme exporter protein CcmD